jgi:hypothetical protein
VKCPSTDLRLILGPDVTYYVCDGCGVGWCDPAQVCDPEADELRSAVYAALKKVAEQRLDRRALPAGAEYHLVIPVVAVVGNEQFSEIVNADVRVGHPTPTSGSSGPKLDEVLAYALSKLSKRRHNEILRELPEDYAHHKNTLPEIPEDLVRATKQMLERLRTKHDYTAAAPISVTYRIEGDHDRTASQPSRERRRPGDRAKRKAG